MTLIIQFSIRYDDVFKKVSILLKKEKNIFKMMIHDDGKGFDMQAISAYNGNGIKELDEFEISTFPNTDHCVKNAE